MNQLLLHLFGDYFLQSDYLALEKHKNTPRCLIHVFLYTLPFLLITHSIFALAFIFSTHFLIDRYSLVKYVIYLKNHLNPAFTYIPWVYCNQTGYHDKRAYDLYDGKCAMPLVIQPRPLFITIWLYIISDNTLHLACNAFALYYL